MGEPITTDKLGEKLQDLFDSSHCAFYPEEDDMLSKIENTMVNKSVETNATIILQHTFVITVILAIVLSISRWIYKYFYFIPSQKYDPSSTNVNIMPTTVIWGLTTILTGIMLIIGGISRNPIYLVWGTGVFIIFIILLFKIFLTERSAQWGSASLISMAKLLSSNTSNVSIIGFVLKILGWILIFMFGIFLIMGAFSVTANTSHIVFAVMVLLINIIPLFLIYYANGMQNLIARNSI